MKSLFCYLFLVITTFLNAQQPVQDTLYLFFLGGQSNMEGYGYNEHLPDSLNSIQEDVLMFNGNAVADGAKDGGLGNWSALQPGYGVGFYSKGKKNIYSNRFGLELTLGKVLKEQYSNRKIAFIKYARGGSSLDSLSARFFGSWAPDFQGKQGINQYDHFQNTLKNAYKVKDINGDGLRDVLIPKGIFWMQGEGDAETVESSALDYEKNLSQLVHLIRLHLGNAELPIVIGKISDSGDTWPYGEIVMDAQESYVKKDINATIVRDTEDYAYSDPWHYDSQGYIDLGIAFANAYIQLLENLRLEK